MVDLLSKMDPFWETASSRSGTLSDHISGTSVGIPDLKIDSDSHFH